MITKKDGLARNLKRMRGVYGATVYNFSPIAFNLPHDYTRFVTEYTKQKEKQKETGKKNDLYWICKPADLSRGRGIFVFKDLSELTYDCTAVVQRYISHPFLIGGYKFDLRIYVSVPSYHPLRIYIHEEGLVRFSTDKYDLDRLGNLFSHLTNTSINKHSPMYAADKDQIGSGCKWTLTQLRHYFRQENINDQTLWMKIINIIILTLIIQHSQVPPAENCYELYGFDIIIDENLKPWLLEVNFSPAMSCDSQVDVLVKKPMLHDMLDMLEFKEEDCKRGGKTHHRNMVNKSRTYDTDQFRYGKKYQASSEKSGKLPHISRSSSSCVSPGGSNEESDSDTDVVPVLAGGGLPSVQIPRGHSTSRHNCTACHHGPPRNLELSDSYKSNFEDWRTKSQTRSPSGSSKNLHVTDPSKQNVRHLDVDFGRLRKNSPSNISDAYGSMEKLSISDSKKNQITARMFSGSSYSRDENFIDHNKQPSRHVFGNREKTYKSASMESLDNSSYQYSHSGHRPSRKSQSGESTRSSGRQGSTASQHHRKQLNADPHVDSKPPRKPSVGRDKAVTTSVPKNNSQTNSRSSPKFVPRYGGFHLVFPFNEITQKCAVGSTLDLRTVVGECHKALQQNLQSRGKKCVTQLWIPLSEYEISSSTKAVKY